MAFDKTKFNRLAAGPTGFFSYVSAEAAATVAGADYFLDVDVQPQINVDDVIMIVDTNLQLIDFLQVLTSTSAGITTKIANGT